MARIAALVGLSLFIASTASARPENDVIVYDASQSTTTALVSSNEYKHLITELGLMVSSKVLSPSNTLGANGQRICAAVSRHSARRP